MARGWESKDVDARQQDRESRDPPRPTLTPQEIEMRARIAHLQLQRTRILAEMQQACNSRFRGQLEASLAHLDRELAKLQ